MTKFAAIVIAIYFLYYVGNVIYDLFLKKEITVKNEETEEFSLMEFSEEYEDDVKDIGIEDVENLNMPNSFTKRELQPSPIEESEEREDIDYWREKFEFEQNIDSFHQNNEVILSSSSEETHSTPNKTSKDKWCQLLNLAETSVQLVSNNDGYKIYQSMM
ncbi:hypothetical protein [Kaistella sp.]|uniref:hypothetical protein n=1 Tax=Kaistella sp. TaxID=2782235 RepID=UPI003C413586